jgi:glycosyltransferase involved in cell wall biosynthesis
MKVSILIPVYNAAEYVQQAVESALSQPETGEVILVEDASTDNSLAVCRDLASRYPLVRLYRHPDGGNHGEAASRNLAISMSTCEYIACLDADDFYLPDRFSTDREIFNSDPTIEGVYGALGEYIENEAARERWLAANRSMGKMTTMTKRVSPEQIYETLVAGQHGYFHLNCTTVNRGVLEKTGPFNEKLRLHTDMDMLWKIAAVARLAPGKLEEPITIRRIHGHNTISTPRPCSDVYGTWMLLFREAWHWGSVKLPAAKHWHLLHRYLTYAEFSRLNQAYPKWSHIYQRRIWLMMALLQDPSLIKESYFWQRLLPGCFFSSGEKAG